MSFKPLQTQTRAHSGVTLGYATRLTKGLNKNPKSRMLEFSISPQLVQQLKLKDGDILRLDADADQGLGRLLPVQVLNKASRKVFLSNTGRGAWQIPWSGEVVPFFPEAETMLELTGAHVSADQGLLFDLPMQVTRGAKA